MKTHQKIVLAVLGTALCGLTAFGQGDAPKANPEGNRPQPPVPPAGAPGLPGFLARLDADHDGALSAAEIGAAAERLKKLDRNADGEVSADEIRGGIRERLGREGGRPGGPQRARGLDRADAASEGNPPPAGNVEAGDRGARRPADATEGPRFGRGRGPGAMGDAEGGPGLRARGERRLDRDGERGDRADRGERGERRGPPASRLGGPDRDRDGDRDGAVAGAAGGERPEVRLRRPAPEHRGDGARLERREFRPLPPLPPRGGEGRALRAERGERTREAGPAICPHCGHRLPPLPGTGHGPEREGRRGA